MAVSHRTNPNTRSGRTAELSAEKPLSAVLVRVGPPRIIVARAVFIGRSDNQISVCTAISSASSTSISRYLTVLSSLVWPSNISHMTCIQPRPHCRRRKRKLPGVGLWSGWLLLIQRIWHWCIPFVLKEIRLGAWVSAVYTGPKYHINELFHK